MVPVTRATPLIPVIAGVVLSIFYPIFKATSQQQIRVKICPTSIDARSKIFNELKDFNGIEIV